MLKIPLLYFPCYKQFSLLFCDKPLPIRIWYIGLWNSGRTRKPEATKPAIALQAVEAGIEGKARAFERTIMSRRSRENSIDEKRRIRNERNKRKRLSRIMEREAKKIEKRKKETRIRVLNNWLVFTMPNGRN